MLLRTVRLYPGKYELALTGNQEVAVQDERAAPARVRKLPPERARAVAVCRCQVTKARQVLPRRQHVVPPQPVRGNLQQSGRRNGRCFGRSGFQLKCNGSNKSSCPSQASASGVLMHERTTLRLIFENHRQPRKFWGLRSRSCAYLLNELRPPHHPVRLRKRDGDQQNGVAKEHSPPCLSSRQARTMSIPESA